MVIAFFKYNRFYIKSAMKRLCYMSRAQHGLGNTARDAILQASIRNNTLAGITGLLLCDGSRFLQALEGEDQSVDDCWNRIRQDDRHFDAVVVEESPIQHREFGGWALNCRSQLVIDVPQFRSLVFADVAQVANLKLKAMFIGFAALAR